MRHIFLFTLAFAYNVQGLAAASCLIEAAENPACAPAQIVLYAGPNQMLAGQGEITLTAELLTQAGEVTGDGLDVIFTLFGNDGTLEYVATTRLGLATVSVPSPERAQTLHIEARHGTLRNQAYDIRIFAGPVTPFTLAQSQCFASGQCLIHTDILTDHLGNVIEDGRHANLSLSDGGHVKKMWTSQVQDGRVSARIRRPVAANSLGVTISIDALNIRQPLPSPMEDDAQ